MTGGKPLPGTLRTWAASVVGPVTGVRDAAWPRVASRVWELTCDDGDRFFLKVAPTPKFFTYETRAYRSAVSSLDAGHAPRLVGTLPEHLALLLTAAPGTSVSALELTDGERRLVHRHAGALLRRLHGDGQLDAEARAEVTSQAIRLAEQADMHLTRAGDLITDRDRAIVKHAVQQLPEMQLLPAAYAHGDFQERNWLWSHGSLALVDFERARHTWAVWDLVRLACGPWEGHPGLQQAFLDGYGRDLTDIERYALGCLAALDAVSAITWGADNDSLVAERGRHTLDRLAKGERLV
ncbi:phosphotransferase [Streptomyces sp. NPDC048419]|uniref:phosphotransferase n=1 Tax=Streptomyces sp. NPDC048419 TaxID=3365547 RepID=UPI003716E0EB